MSELTDKQNRVMSLKSEGKPNKQIAFILGIARCKEPTGAETLALFVNRLDHSLQ